MPVLLLLFGAATGLLGFTLWKESHRRVRERHGRPLPPASGPGTAVDIDWLGDGVVVKVYYENRAYTAHVYWHEEFVGDAGGFGTTDAAIGWGRSHARSLGADV